ncbi:MAG: response regulator [Deltaproteobacteria bacterium]|nr:response regulator [Deltaproteobacteria bacterium]
MDKKKVLIIDDEQDLIDLLTLRLENEGYEVSAALNGTEGLEKIKSEKPDIVLLDVMMPELNGYQVCRKLKQDDNLKDIPVVMLTAKAQESDKFWGMEIGADDYVTKPFEFSQLSEVIKKYLPNK